MEKIWYKDMGNFITENNYDKFFPSVTMTYTEKLNSIMRLCIYFSAVLLLIKKDANVLFVPMLAAICTFFLNSNEIKKNKMEFEYLTQRNLYKDEHTNELCYKPTKQNPFMNILMSDYTQNPNRAKACNLSNGNIKKMASKHFNRDLYRDVGDVFHKNASDRNYMTMPVSTIPNNQDDFLKFTYNINKTCKEGSGKVCYANTYRTSVT